MEKVINSYSTKTTAEIKDISTDKREVAIYLSKFGNVDSDMDMVQKGAFKKSLEERGPSSASNRKIAFLRYHDWEHQIGKFLKLEEDEFGLFAVAQCGNSTKGEDAWQDYQDGIIREHSIGFQYMMDKIKWVEDSTMDSGGFYMITEVKLYEGSAVLFGANEETPTIAVMKSENRKSYAQKISSDIDLVAKAIVNGKGTDERLYELEMKLKYLNNQLLLLAQTEPLDVKHSIIVEPTLVTESSFDWNKVVTGLKI
jgi:HK97 family phage prohead protease